MTALDDMARWQRIGRMLEPHLPTIERALSDVACDTERGQYVRDQADAVHDVVLVAQNKRPMGAT